MSKVLIDRRDGLLRAAFVQDGRLQDLQIDAGNEGPCQGALYWGKVARIVGGMEAAFVVLGDGPQGFLGLNEARYAAKISGVNAKRIGQLLRGGDTVLVQVKAAAHADKGPSLTTDITLPGRFVVLAPYGRGVTLSKRLNDADARRRISETLSSVAPLAGWIGRAAAAQVPGAVLEAETAALWRRWQHIMAEQKSLPAPAKIADGPPAWERLLVDLGSRPVSAILTDDPVLHGELAAWTHAAAPDLAAGLQLTNAAGLSALCDVDAALLDLSSRRVPLGNGGSLVIDRTEALTVIDVNGGESGNPLAVNLAAVPEIARQLRLRNIGGIIVVDFVSMRGGLEGEQVLGALSQAVSNDGAATHVYGMSKLGLVELTRARRGAALADILAKPIAERPQPS